MLYIACGILHTLPSSGATGQCDHTGADQGSMPARDTMMASWQRHLCSREYILQCWSAIAVLLSCCQLATADLTARQRQSETQCFAVRVWTADEQYLCEVDLLSQLWAFDRQDSSHDV